ncbi:MAG: xanthine dehydrogenase family protein molybdopterin-binding subunit [Betaproteobacteria bacterium]|nr:xanthine dehydrogenase family protein molybdopterin-binding subunit [Betaproteobacteria bacterium]
MSTDPQLGPQVSSRVGSQVGSKVGAAAAPAANQPRVIGQRARRIEDPALLRGAGRFLDDVPLVGAAEAAFVRSPHAHARIVSIDCTAARAMPGVVAVYAAADIAAGLTGLRMPLGFPSTTLPPDITPFVLAPREVCFVGEAIAMVVAESRHLAEDAAAAVGVEYESLPAVTDCRMVLDEQAPKVRSDAPSNTLTRFRVAYGDCARVFAGAKHVFAESIKQHRGGAHPIEGRGAAASMEQATGILSVWSSTQMSHDLMYTLSAMLDMAENRVRVIAPDVGGGFGCKFLVYPEEVAIAAAARMLKRPVKWVEDRQEHFVASIQERDQYWDLEIAVDADAAILGVRGRLIHDQGAYTPQGINCAYNASTGVTGPYLVPNYDLDVHVAQTNMVYTIPVRGAGYPEAAFVMERLVDRVAQELRLDRAEVRRRNLVPVAKMPYEKPLKSRSGAAIILDSGDYHACLEKVLAHVDWAGFPARQRAARALGRHIGLGLSNAVKGTGRGPFESATVKVAPSGRVHVYTGALAMGQGIKTSLAQVAAEQLGVNIADIEVIAGDTAFVSLGIGGFASRQAVTAGSSVHFAAVAVREKAVKVAAKILEAAEADLDLQDGKVVIKGTDRSVPLAEIARQLRGVAGYSLPQGVEAGLESTFHWQTDAMPYANAVHACEVEVDIDTGGVTLLRYVALQDSGKLLNPLIVEGQLHGGIVHGIGNALFEWMGYDAQGQPITTTFADYLLPTSTELPNIELLFHESPSPFNPLGVKGVGEGGTIPVVAAVISAVENALQPFGVHISEAPLSPVRVLELIMAAEAKGRAAAA